MRLKQNEVTNYGRKEDKMSGDNRRDKYRNCNKEISYERIR